MKNRRNYYRVLQVQPDAAPDVVKASYRTLMQKLRIHPDLGGDEWNATLVNEAYAVLSDPARRARYDAAREAARMGTGVFGRVSGTPAPEDTAAWEPVDPVQHARQDPYTALTCVLCRTPNNVNAGSAGPHRCRACDSPLTPVSATGAGRVHERAVPRLERRTPVRYARAAPVGGAGNGVVEDLSSHGMRFVTDTPLAAGDVLRIECALLGAVGRVVTCRPHASGAGHSVGVAFVTADFHRSRGSLLAVEV